MAKYKNVAAFRIAMRTTDDGWWVALLTRVDNMGDPIEMARIRRVTIEDPEIREKFLEIQTMTIERILKGKGIDVAEWKRQNPDG
jgi:hypothetical protein